MHPLEECLELLDEPTYRFPKVSSYAIRCWGYTGSTAQSTLNLHPGVSILQHITSLSRKLFTSDLRKASTIQAMAILSNYLPSTGWCRGYLATGRIGEIFDVGRLKYLVLPRYACDDNTPKLNSRDTATTPNVRRHREQYSRHKDIETIPQYSRDS